jgi:hypothetical protein
MLQKRIKGILLPTTCMQTDITDNRAISPDNTTFRVVLSGDIKTNLVTNSVQINLL